MTAPPRGPGESDPPPEVPAPAKATERPHPLTPLIRGWVVLVAVMLAVGRQLLDNGGTRGLPSLHWIAIGVATICVIAAVAGFVTWYFTRFVIDAEELRIESGAIFRSSKRIAFERIQTVDLLQPFAARIFGLAELRIDVGTGEHQTRLRYLSRADATRLRDYLVARAHGERADAGRASSADLITDRSLTDRVVAQVPSSRLVAAFFTSTEFWSSLIGLGLVYLITGILHVAVYALPALIPYLIGLISMIGRSVFAQFHYTLAESGRGLRVTRGLANLTSQSIPLDRIQGVRIAQPLLWRPWGWYRIDVDVLGVRTTRDENNASARSSVLQPVATADQVRAALELIWPDADADAIALHRVSRRAAVLRPFDFWTLRYGWDDELAVVQHGWLIRVHELVPHAKTQSVRIVRGPVQNRLRLASVHLDTTPGPVDAVLRHLDHPIARSFALGQLDRARAARARSTTRPGPSEPTPSRVAAGPAEAALLDRFGIAPDSLLGAGNESRVFALADGRHVLRVFPPSPAPRRDTPLRTLLDGFRLGSGHPPFPVALPVIVDAGRQDGQDWRVEQRFAGRDLSTVLAATPTTSDRRALLLGYLDVAMMISRLPTPTGSWARLVEDPAVFGSLTDLLADQLRRSARMSVEQGGTIALAERLGDLDARRADLLAELAERVCAPVLTHGDYGPPNVFAQAGRITGVGDFSAHTLVADPLLDVVGAVAFVELERYPDARSDARWLAGVAADRVGADARWFDAYRRFYGLYYSMDLNLLDWCAAQFDGHRAAPR